MTIKDDLRRALYEANRRHDELAQIAEPTLRDEEAYDEACRTLAALERQWDAYLSDVRCPDCGTISRSDLSEPEYLECKKCRRLLRTND